MKTLITVSTVITFLLMLCTLDDVLSLHDIRADYVSKAALDYLHVETSEALPSWTETRLEWRSVTVSVALRSLLISSNLVVLVLIMRRLPRASRVPVGR